MTSAAGKSSSVVRRIQRRLPPEKRIQRSARLSGGPLSSVDVLHRAVSLVVRTVPKDLLAEEQTVRADDHPVHLKKMAHVPDLSPCAAIGRREHISALLVESDDPPATRRVGRRTVDIVADSMPVLSVIGMPDDRRTDAAAAPTAAQRQQTVGADIYRA